MRVAIIIGCLIISDSINQGRFSYNENTMKILSILFTIFVIMDLIDFFRGKK